MKHILGMTKSFLDLKGGRRPILELDYLRLVYAVDGLRKSGDNAQGYLVVLEPRISECVKRWENKYRGKDFVEVICAPLSPTDKDALKQEKINNKAGMVAGATGGEVGDRSSANLGRHIGEDALKNKILELEPGVLVKDKSKYPLDVDWDFYGVVD